MAQEKQSKQLKVTLVKGLIGRTERQKACVRGLGLSRIRQSVLLKEDPCIMGMIKKVIFLLKVEVIEHVK